MNRVLVTKAHPRYEKIKRLLAHQLSIDDEGNASPGPLTIELIRTKVDSLFDTLTPEAARPLSAGTLSAAH